MELSTGLFRKEAMEARRGEWLGTIQLATPLSRWVLTLLAVSIAAAILLFLIFGHYTRRSRVSGQLVPSTGVLIVNAHASGQIDQVHVHEGEVVHHGDPLLEISMDTDSVALGDVRADISNRLRAQRSRLESDLSTQRDASREQSRQLKHQLGLLRAQRHEIDDQLALESQRVKSDRKLLERIEPLGEKGYVSAFQVQQQQTQLLQDRTQSKILMRQKLGLEQQISDTQQKLAQIPLDLTTHSNGTQRQLSEVEQQLAQNEAERAVLLRAPKDGVVSTLLAKPGQTVSAGESLLSILPQGATLHAQLLVPSRAVGFIEPGSRVVLRYQAYPYQKFGQQYGRISGVSRSALSPSEIVALTGARANQPLYRVKVRLDRQDILAYGKPQPLKPGMAVDADILMDRRSLLEWVFEPLFGLSRHISTPEVNHG